MNKKDKKNDIIKLISKSKFHTKIDDICNDKKDIDIYKIINNALNVESAKRPTSENNSLRRDELLEKTKENSIINFLNDLQNKSIEQIKNTFMSKIKENSAVAQIQIKKAKKKTKDYMSKSNIISEENKKMNQKILDMNNKYRKLDFQLKKSQSTISQMQINDENLKPYKLLFDEFLLQYPNKDPIKHMEEIQRNKTNFINKFYEYNDLQKKIEFDKKDYKQRLQQGKKTLAILNEKLSRIEESNKLKRNENEIIINGLKNEKNTLQKLKEDNNKYRKMLFNLYTRLLNALKLNKKIKIDKKYLQITEKDFYPNLLDDREIYEYIKAMTSSANSTINDQALKETIAYSNMIIRIYLKNRNSLRYDPLNTFKELKSIMEEKEQKIIKLSDKVKDFEIKLNTMELENKKLNNLLIHFNQERIKNLSNKSSFSRYQSPNLKRSVSVIRNKNTILKNMNNQKINMGIKRPMSGVYRGGAHVHFYDKKDKNRDKNNVDNDKSVAEDELDTELINDRKVNLKSSYNFFLSKNSNSSFNNDLLNSVEMKEFRKIKESKNRDKILKVHNQQRLVKCINEFNQLINHTNRLFVYKAKIAPKDKRNNLPNLSKNKICIKNMKKSKSVEEFKNDKNKIVKDEDLSLEIVKKLNDLIQQIENVKDKKQKNVKHNEASKYINKSVDKIF